MFALVQAPPGGTLPRTQKALDVVRVHFLKDEKAAVDSVFTVSGFSFNGQGQNAGLAFIKLKDWKDRSSSENKAQALVGRAMGVFSKYRDATIFALMRSEEHTSELQSLMRISYAVFCLKKKKNNKQHHVTKQR